MSIKLGPSYAIDLALGVNEVVQIFLLLVQNDKQKEAKELASLIKIPQVMFNLSAENQMILDHQFWSHKFVEWGLLPQGEKLYDADRKIFRFLEAACSFSQGFREVLLYFVQRVDYTPEEVKILFELYNKKHKFYIESKEQFFMLLGKGVSIEQCLGWFIRSDTSIDELDLLCVGRGVSLNTLKDPVGNTLLHMSTRCFNINLAECALKMGINPNVVNSHGDTCLDLTLKNCNDAEIYRDAVAIIKLLKDHGLGIPDVIDSLIKCKITYFDLSESVNYFLVSLCKLGVDFALLKIFFEKTKVEYGYGPHRFLFMYRKKLLSTLDTEILQIAQGTADEKILKKLNSVFTPAEARVGADAGASSIPNLFHTAYADLLERATQFIEELQKIPSLNTLNYANIRKFSRRLYKRVKTLAALAHTTDLGRQQALQMAQLDTQAFPKETPVHSGEKEPVNKKHKK